MRRAILAVLLTLLAMSRLVSVACAEVVPDEVIAKFQPNVSLRTRALVSSRLGLTSLRTVFNSDFTVYRVPASMTPEQAMERLQSDPSILYAERNPLLHVTATPDDPYYPQQWNLHPVTSGEFGIDLPAAWSISTGDGVSVAVLDTGCAYETFDRYYANPDLDPSRIRPGPDFVNGDGHPNDDSDFGHGTHLCSLIGQITNNGTGASGIAPGCTLVPVKCFDSQGAGTADRLASGLSYARMLGAPVILVGGASVERSQCLQDLITQVTAAGALVVAGAGNDGVDPTTTPGAQALYDGVMYVGATGRSGALAPYSNRGAFVSVVAPGGADDTEGPLAATYSPYDANVPPFDFRADGTSVQPMHGTSVAAAHVAGVAALVMGALPGLPATEARARIEARTFRLGDPSLVGAGLVDAAAAVGAVAVSDPSVFAPNAPTGLAAKLHSVSEVGLTWSDNSGNEEGFELQFRQPGGSWQPAGVLDANTTSIVADGLTPLSTYLFRLRAINAVADSAWSNEVSLDTVDPPTAPTGLAVAARMATQIDLAWSDNSDNERAFEVWRKSGTGSFTRVAVLPPNTTAYSDLSLTPGTTYTYRVRATRNEGASAWTNEAAATTLSTPPRAPTGLSVRFGSMTQLNLTWTDASGDETGFEIQRRTPGAAWAPLTALPAGGTGYSDTSVNRLTTYIYRVRAVNSVGPSAWSNEAWGDTANPPAAPTGLTATGTSASQIGLSWTDNSSNERAFEVYRQNSSGSFVRIAVMPPNTTTFTDRGLSPETSCTYRVRATSNEGASAWSNVATGTSLALAPPATASGLSVSVTSLTQLDLTWTDRSLNESGFEVQRKEATGDWVTVTRLPANTTHYSDTGLTPWSTYTYRVRSFNGVGPAREWSNEATADTTVAPEAPTGLRMRVAAPGWVAISWTDNSSGEIGYEVFRRGSGSEFVSIGLLPANTTLFVDQNPELITPQTYRVRAIGIKGVSDWSNEVTVIVGGGLR